jgi:hypothetical protein
MTLAPLPFGSAPGRRRALRTLRAPGDQFDTKTLAEYRLTEPVFKRFAHATRLLSNITHADARFEREPLITREISVSGDAPEMAAALQRRLDSEPALAAALFAADISAHEYALFAIALFAARMAAGFVKSGAMRRVPPGVAAENVAFVTAHEREITALLKQLKLDETREDARILS